MKYTKTTIKELTKRYAIVLKKCAFLNMIALTGAFFATSAVAANTPLGVVANDTALSGTYEDYVNTDSTKAGVATLNYNTTGVSVADGTIFSNNETQKSAGGVLKVLNGMTVGNNVEFNGNKATNNGWGGGAMYIKLADGTTLSENGTVSVGENTVFSGNEAGLGGAIALEYGNLTLGNGVTFDGNKALTGSNQAGGAIAMWQDSKDHGDIKSTLTATNAIFKNNVAGNAGGAISVGENAGTANVGGLFESNSANNGGAIYNADTVTVATGTQFNKNTATGDGGAIYNTGDMTITGRGVFANNTAKTYGGAIANEGTLTIAGTADAMVEFNNNKAAQGSAIQTGVRLKSGVLNLDYTSFSGNEGDYQGAIANFHEMTVTNSVFNGNKVTAEIANDGFNNHLLATSVDGGGAIYAGSASTNSISSSTFTNNTVTTDGGAIATRVDWKNDVAGKADGSANDYAAENKNAVLKIETSTFDNNTAGLSGGAVYNTFRQTSVADSTFTNNTAKNGGAIANEALATVSFTGTNTFTGNKATEFGGAILNKGEMTFDGNTVFANNTANGVANDMHNTGNLTFNGDVSFTGGVTGDGKIAFNGDTLDIGSSIIHASSISIKDGSTLRANLLSGTAGFDAAELSGNNLNLVFDQNSVGGSLVFTQGNGSDLTFTENNLFDLVVQDDGSLVVDRKSADKIVDQFVSAGVADPIAATGIATIVEATPTTPQAQAVASTIMDLAQSKDTADQQKAAELTKATQPTQAPIRQAVTINTQVIKTAADRMAQLRQGRSGGDLADAKLSPWVRGLFSKNHNSQGDGFDAYTHGFSFGVDAQVTESVLLGAGYARSATTVKEDMRRTHVNGDNYFVYGKYQPSQWYVESILNYGHNKAKSEALGLSAKYSIDTYGAQLFSGYQYGIADNYVGVRYVYVNPDDYDNGLNEVEGKSSQVATAVIGTRIAKEFQYRDNLVFKPEFRLAGTYDFKSDNSTANVNVIGGNTVYSVEGERLHRAALATGVGLTAKYGQMEVTAGYDIEWRVSNFAQTGMLKLKYNF